MIHANRTVALGGIAAPVLALGIAGCGGGGGPGSLASDEDWNIRVSGARSFGATGYGNSDESKTDDTGIVLEAGVLDDDTPESNEQARLSMDFGSDFDPETLPSELEATGTLDRYDITYENMFREEDELASYGVDDSDPETYLDVSLESFEYERKPTSSDRGGATGTFEGKLVDKDKAGEYVEIEGAFAFSSLF